MKKLSIINLVSISNLSHEGIILPLTSIMTWPWPSYWCLLTQRIICWYSYSIVVLFQVLRLAEKVFVYKFNKKNFLDTEGTILINHMTVVAWWPLTLDPWPLTGYLTGACAVHHQPVLQLHGARDRYAGEWPADPGREHRGQRRHQGGVQSGSHHIRCFSLSPLVVILLFVGGDGSV